MLATRLKARIGEDKILVLHLPTVPPGDVELIIYLYNKFTTKVISILSK